MACINLCCVKFNCGNVDKLRLMERVYKILMWCVKILGITLLVTFTLWLTIRPVTPSCYLTKFDLKTFEQPDSNVINLRLVLLNQDIYKGIHYDVIVGRITFSRWDASYGVWVFNTSSVYQWPGTSKHFANESVDFSINFSPWKKWLEQLMGGEQYFKVKVFMVYRYKILFWTSETKLTMKAANVYFTHERKAYVPPSGLSLM